MKLMDKILYSAIQKVRLDKALDVSSTRMSMSVNEQMRE